MDYRQKKGEFSKNQEISFQMSTGTSTFSEKMAEKIKVKVREHSKYYVESKFGIWKHSKKGGSWILNFLLGTP